jgi:phage shock protein A
MDLAIIGLLISAISATAAVFAGVSFWIGRGKVEERADQALAQAKEAHGRYDGVMSAFADYRAAMAADIAIVKTLAESNTAALASAENRLAAAIEQMNARFGELNQRIDRLLDGREG